MPDAYSGNRTRVKIKVNNPIIRNHMPYTYMALILSELPDEVIDTYIAAPIEEDEAVVLEMSVGEVYKLPLLGKGDKGAETIQWSSSDESVVALKGINLLAAKGVGSATLTAAASHGKQAVVEVRVTADQED